MATRRSTPQTQESSISLTTESSPRPRLDKLIIKNYRSIGENPITIHLDDIVLLVGQNNAGKSSILKAYEIVMSHGSKDGNLTINDFPNGVVDVERLPTIELHTIVFDKAPGECWIQKLPNDEFLIRERWIWDSPNKAPKRQGFHISNNEWDDQVPWGAPNVANARRPLPHRIDAFASPDAQTKEIINLITTILREKIEDIKTDSTQEKTDYQIILEKIKDLQGEVVKATESEVKVIEEKISTYLERLFPKHKIKFDAKPESDLDKTFTPFKNNVDLLMGPEDGFFSTIEHQGSGARRTLLWAALKFLSEQNDKQSSRPHVLLLDEPEICLHPSAIREARRVLYDLPSSKKWQVMITSHSPIFIDLSMDNTTIVRVFRDEALAVRSTTLYRPTEAKLDIDDKRNLKIMNVCDPYVHEFFFGGRQIIVEGDTEYTAFSILKEENPEKYGDVQIIRARGKGIIPSIAKVLLQFSKAFTILHDSDNELTDSGAKNPAWGMNETILKIRDNSDNVRLVACKTCFEIAMFDKETKAEKPYNTLSKMHKDNQLKAKVKTLFDFLLDATSPIPDKCIEWCCIEDLKR